MSDVIDRAIEKQYHINDLSMLKDVRWKDFESTLRNRRLFLYGLGCAIPFLWKKYVYSLCVTGCIDRDKKAIGDRWELRVASFSHPAEYECRIAGPDILDKYNTDDVVILVLSLRQYAEICCDLANKGYHNVFSLLTMEAGEREKEQGQKEHVDIVESWLSQDRELPIIQNKILILIGVHGGHGRAITKRLINIKKDIEVVWIVNRYMDDAPDGVCQVHEKNLFEYYYAINTAKIIIIDIVWNLPDTIKKDGQIFIQVKHWASITLKKFGAEESNIYDRDKRIADSGTWDYVLIGSRFDEDSCRSGFPGTYRCIDVGSPRSDALFDKALREKIYKYYEISEKYHTILYAPTFRSHDGIPIQVEEEMDYIGLKRSLIKRFNGCWKILIRLHPLLANAMDYENLPDDCMNVSKYEDMEELVSASDIMISDYSSVMFEPAFVKKPVFLYAPDKNEYVNKEKDLLLDYDSLPHH